MPGSPLLQVKQASFGYDHRPVVENIDLAIDAGQFLCVAGPNGGGKTTLFRGILGLIAPLEGQVEMRASAVGYVPQREHLDPLYPLSVAEVVYMGAYGRLSGLRRLRSEERQLAADCLARVDMAHHSKRPFASLSGGQRQRVLIARALMARPELLLLDEPTSGVDAEAVERISAWLQELAGEGIAVLVVTHQLDVFRDLGDGILWVAEGGVTRRPSHGGPTT